MKKFLTPILALMLFANVANAGKFLNGTTGSNSNDGSYASPWATAQYASSQLAANETLYVAAYGSSYGAVLLPSVEGTVWVGDSTANRKIVFSDLTFGTNNTTLIGLTTYGLGWNGGAYSDLHIRKCALLCEIWATSGPYDRIRFASCTVGNDSITSRFYFKPSNGGSDRTCDGLVITGCTMKLRPSSCSNTTDLFALDSESPSVIVNGAEITGNTITTTWPAGCPYNASTQPHPPDVKPIKFRHINLLYSVGNTYTFRDSNCWTGSENMQGIVWRDNVTNNLWFNDQFIVTNVGNTSGIGAITTSSGNDGAGLTSKYNVWRYCTFKNDISNSSIPAIYWQAGMWQGDSITRCVFLTNKGGTGLQMVSARGTATFYRNTVANIGAGIAADIEIKQLGQKVSTNIFYSHGTNSAAPALRYTQASGGSLLNLRGDYNCVWNNFAGTGSLAWGVTNTNAGSAGTPCNAAAQECNSIKTTPYFVDSTFATFYPTPRGTSLTIAAGLNGETMGARDTTGTDTTAPSAVSTLALLSAGTQTALMNFTTTGDDTTAGTPNTYDVRWSTATITSGNFSSATQITSTACLPNPAVAGTVVTFSPCFNPPFPSNRIIYVAMKVLDEAGNTSTISNVVTVQLASSGGGGGGIDE